MRYKGKMYMSINYHWMNFCIIFWIAISFRAKTEITSGRTIDRPLLNIDASFIDVSPNSIIELKCTGWKSLSWGFLHPMESFEEFSLPPAIEQEVNATYVSLITLKFESYLNTGSYSCFYEEDSEKKDSLYVFVNDVNHLLLPQMGYFLFVDVFQSRPTHIPCYPTFSKANVTLWKRFNNKLMLIPTSDSMLYSPQEGFTLKFPSREHNGQFICKADYDGHQQEMILHLTFISDSQSVPQVYIDKSGAQYVLIGSQFTLSCIAEVETGIDFVVKWAYPISDPDRIKIKQHVVENPDGIPVTIRNETLIISNAQKDDEGLYQCNVTDHSNKKNYYEVFVKIHESEKLPSVNFAKMINSNETVIIKRNDNFKLKSEFHVFPQTKDFKLYWTKDGVQIISKIGKYKISESASESALNLLNVSGSDSGVYTLVGEASGGITSISFKVLVKDVPVVTIDKPPPCCFMVGKNYSVICNSSGFPLPEVSWKWKPYCFEGSDCGDPEWKPIEDFLSVNNVQINYGKKSLAAIFVQAHVSGYYMCEGRNEVGITQQSILFIVSDVDDGFSVTVDSIEPEETEPFSAICAANLVLYTEPQWVFTPMGSNVSSIPFQASLNRNNTLYSHSLEMKFDAVSGNESGQYTCIAHQRSNSSSYREKTVEVQVQAAKPPSFVDRIEQGAVFRAQPNLRFELSCSANSIPQPSIMWYRDGEVISENNSFGARFEDRRQKLIFTRVVKDDSGHYQCLVENKVGFVSRNMTLVIDTEDVYIGSPKAPSSNPQIGVEVIIGLGVIISVALALLFFGLCIFQRKRVNRMSIFHEQSFREGHLAMYNPEMPLDEQAELLPYDERWEIGKDRIKLGKTLGQGAFGRVVRAEVSGLNDSEEPTTVAVKMLKERADVNQQKALMAELKILIHLGHHVNIVNLLGAVTKNTHSGELYVVVEYCQYGNLRHYLLRHRDKFIDQCIEASPVNEVPTSTFGSFTTFGKNSMSSQSSTSSQFALENPSYSRQTGSYASTGSKSPKTCRKRSEGSFSSNGPFDSEDGGCCRVDSNERLLTTSDLLCFAFQCARGMEYLAGKKLIHRDLAARNVLLSDDNVVKICDFGLAKDCYKYSNYVRKGDGPLPIKWMAVESIGDKVFTTKSDVWSFGVLLWEFFSLGANPYPGVEVDEEFYRRLKIGYRMEKPSYSPNIIYQIMRDCWQIDPNNRPDFTELSNLLGSLLEDSVRQQLIGLNDPYLEMNVKLQEHNYLNDDLVSETPYMNTEFAQDLLQYDKVPPTRFESNAPMEIVPMIYMNDTLSQANQENELEP